jgi:hypothetical protein
MKRKLFMIAFAAVSVCVMVACGSKDGSKEKADAEQVAEETSEVTEEASENEENGEEADARVEDEIVAMINDIFDDSDIEYTTNDQGYMEANIDLIMDFGSIRLCNLVEQVRMIDANKDETEHFIADWNWMLNCFDQGGVEDIEVDVDGDTAKAKYWVSNSGMRELYELALVKEDGQWRVDDVLTMGGQKGSKAEEMTKYIEENQ